MKWTELQCEGATGWSTLDDGLLVGVWYQIETMGRLHDFSHVFIYLLIHQWLIVYGELVIKSNISFVPWICHGFSNHQMVLLYNLCKLVHILFSPIRSVF